MGNTDATISNSSALNNPNVLDEVKGYTQAALHQDVGNEKYLTRIAAVPEA
jgi:hypothetical protein